ncbi:Homocysteine S-methyltransferase [Fistulina hepatica ATCC 64428]|uniref:Homocysteine S-methyltransferase n=1 Tax=Fistulina hepatica ATCC 64428 TaxID=1128425 RepID=A0A0D7A7P7_9AGAR|nr:Homocysteine S-methyltransferase [Fistulina hepatica ATCC 64428]
MFCSIKGEQETIVILDGGFGTTIEDFGADVGSTPLWSAESISKAPELIVKTHLAFLRAGAEIILTSTYQCHPDAFRRAGYSHDEALSTMHKSVELAVEARNLFYLERRRESGEESRKIKIALSLGPFGAGIVPGQEYEAIYPPPYGPKAFSPTGDNINTFYVGQEDEEQRSVNALTEFHLERLQQFSHNRAIWDSVDLIAFETIPLLREVRAIKSAMAQLGEEYAKPWWISLVFLGGIFPEGRRDNPGVKLTVGDVVQGICEPGTGTNMSRMMGLGFNCVNMRFLRDLTTQMTDAIRSYWDYDLPKPWLFLYPNGGGTYDPVSRTWGATECFPAQELFELAESTSPGVQDSVWQGVVVGGCCKSRPDDIRVLANEKRLRCRQTLAQ